MKKEIRYKTVEYEIFISDDGTEYNNEKDCKHHDRLVHGEIIECPECNGEGEISKLEKEEDYHTGAPYWVTRYHLCPKCNGKGYLEKKIKEVWE